MMVWLMHFSRVDFLQQGDATHKCGQRKLARQAVMNGEAVPQKQQVRAFPERLPHARGTSNCQDAVMDLEVNVAKQPGAIISLLAYSLCAEMRCGRHCDVKTKTSERIEEELNETIHGFLLPKGAQPCRFFIRSHRRQIWRRCHHAGLGAAKVSLGNTARTTAATSSSSNRRGQGGKGCLHPTRHLVVAVVVLAVLLPSCSFRHSLACSLQSFYLTLLLPALPL